MRNTLRVINRNKNRLCALLLSFILLSSSVFTVQADQGSTMFVEVASIDESYYGSSEAEIEGEEGETGIEDENGEGDENGAEDEIGEEDENEAEGETSEENEAGAEGGTDEENEDGSEDETGVEDEEDELDALPPVQPNLPRPPGENAPERNVTFDLGGLYRVYVALEDIKYVTDAEGFLLEGVRAFDEFGNMMDVMVSDHGGILWLDGTFNIEAMEPGEIFVVVYSTIHHAELLEEYTFERDATAQREYIILDELPLEVTFEFEEEYVLLDDLEYLEINVPNPMSFLLEGVFAFDENYEPLAIEVVDHGGILLEDGSFDLVAIFAMEIGEAFEVIYRAFHPESGEEFIEVREFIVGFDSAAPVMTAVALRTAIQSATGTRDNPTEIIIGASFAIPANFTEDTANGVFRPAAAHARHVRLITDGQQRNLTTGATGRHFHVRGGSTLIIDDPLLHVVGRGTTAGGGIAVNGSNARFELRQGTIRDITHGDSAVRALNGGTLIMGQAGQTDNSLAVITNNRSGAGGGVEVESNNTTFTMHSGTISHNNSTTNGGLNLDAGGGGVRVRNQAVFEMHNGTITENTARNAGGGVFLAGSASFVMRGGEITKNHVDNAHGLFHGGGGVMVQGGNSGVTQFTMHNGLIDGNTARGNGELGVRGGGVALYGIWSAGTQGRSDNLTNRARFIMHNGTISNNDILGTHGIMNSKMHRYVGGGGVGITRDAHFVMRNGTISGNISDSGGGVYVTEAARFDMHDGTISGNTARSQYVSTAAATFGHPMRGGGGVMLYNSGVLEESGSVNRAPRFNMFGGSIINNTALNGGGVFWVVAALSEWPTNMIEWGAYRNTVTSTGTFTTPAATAHQLRVRENALQRVTIGAGATISGNTATAGTRVDNQIWERHRVNGSNRHGSMSANISESMTWSPAFTNATYTVGTSEHAINNPFNNHDIATWGRNNFGPPQTGQVTPPPGPGGVECEDEGCTCVDGEDCEDGECGSDCECPHTELQLFDVLFILNGGVTYPDGYDLIVGQRVIDGGLVEQVSSLIRQPTDVYTFMGWTLQSNAGGAPNPVTYWDFDTDVVTEDITLIAVFEYYGARNITINLNRATMLGGGRTVDVQTPYWVDFVVINSNNDGQTGTSGDITVILTENSFAGDRVIGDVEIITTVPRGWSVEINLEDPDRRTLGPPTIAVNERGGTPYVSIDGEDYTYYWNTDNTVLTVIIPDPNDDFDFYAIECYCPDYWIRTRNKIPNGDIILTWTLPPDGGGTCTEPGCVCPPGTDCENGECVPECECGCTDGTCTEPGCVCPPGTDCENGECVPECECGCTDGTCTEPDCVCPPGTDCENGECVPECECGCTDNGPSLTFFYVTFELNGGIWASANSVRVPSGSTVAQPTNPTRIGHDFMGWTNAGSPFNFSTPILSNTTLYANWQATGDGGTGGGGNEGGNGSDGGTDGDNEGGTGGGGPGNGGEGSGGGDNGDTGGNGDGTEEGGTDGGETDEGNGGEGSGGGDNGDTDGNGDGTVEGGTGGGGPDGGNGDVGTDGDGGGTGEGGTGGGSIGEGGTGDVSIGGTPPQNAPPTPTMPGHTLIQDGDMWIELDENGVPLGAWVWNSPENRWDFVELEDMGIPLAGLTLNPQTGMPQTGLASNLAMMIASLIGSILATLASLLLLFKRQRITLVYEFDPNLEPFEYTQRFNTKLEIPADFKRPGYVVDKLYRDEKHTEDAEWDMDQRVRKSVTLYATWKADPKYAFRGDNLTQDISGLAPSLVVSGK